MGINLKGFATGFAKTLATRIEDERDREEKILSNRFNLAASNRASRLQEVSKLKETYVNRSKEILSVFPMATAAQVAAMVSTDSNFKTAMQAQELGFDEDQKVEILNKYVKPADFPEGVTDFRSLLNEKIKYTAGEQTAQTPREKLLGFINVSPGASTKEKYAAQYGTSSSELEQYADDTGTITDLGVMGSVSGEFLKAPKSPEERLKTLRLSLMDATDEDEKEELKRQIDEAVSVMNYGTSPKTLTEEVNRVSLALEDETDPAKIAMLNKKLDSLNKRIQSNTKAQAQEKDRAKEFGGAIRTYPETRKMVEDAQVAALERMKGITEEDKKRFVVETPEGPKVRRITPKDRPEIAAIAREAALDALRSSGHIRPDGSMTDYARDILIGLGLLVNGKIIPDPMEDIKNAEADRAKLQEERDRKAREEAAAAAAQAQGKAPPPAAASKPAVVVKNWN